MIKMILILVSLVLVGCEKADEHKHINEPVLGSCDSFYEGSLDPLIYIPRSIECGYKNDLVPSIATAPK